MNLKDDVKPITYLKNNTADVIRHVTETGRSMVITQKGEAKAVVMDAQKYDRWLHAMRLPKHVSMGETASYQVSKADFWSNRHC